MIAEVFDPVVVNGFANYPAIREMLGGGDEPLDLTPGIRAPNVFMFGEHGGFCFGWHGPGVYEVHVMLMLAGRGRWGVQAGRLAISLMHERGMAHLWGRIHPERPEMAVYANACGMRDTGQTNEFDIGDGPVAWRIFEWRA